MAAIVISRIVYPFDTGYIEAFSWVPTAHVLNGVNPYAYAVTPPYSMVPYGIVYYSLLAIGQSIFGLQMWFGRSLSVLACVVCVWAAARITKKLTGSRDAVWVACLVSIALFPVQAWIAVMRSDLISLAFGLTAVGLVFAVTQRISAVRMSAIILLSVAAVFTKHTTLLPAGIVFLRLLQLGRRRDAVIFTGAFLALAGVAVFVLNYTSDGGYLWQHFIHAERLPFSWHGWWMVVFPLAVTPTSVIFAGALLLFVHVRLKTKTEVLEEIRSPKLLILFYLFLALMTGLISAGRVGSNVNYFLEASFVLAVVAGWIWNTLRQTEMRRIASAMILLMVLGGTFQLVRFARGESFRWQARSYYQEVSHTARKYILPGSTCVSVYADLVMRQGCDMHFDDYGEYLGGWSPELTSVFEKELASGRYAVIVWDSDNLAEKFPLYRLVPMSQRPPEKFFPVYLYVRNANLEGVR